MKAVQQRETLIKFAMNYQHDDRTLTDVALAGESRIIDEARERQREFEASAYAHRQRMILDLQVMQPAIIIVTTML
jgi:hypothetical protein